MSRRVVSWQIVRLLVLAALATVGWSLPVTTGLRLEVFANEDRKGVPDLQSISPDVSVGEIRDGWNQPLPPVFSARWSGYLIAARGGSYTFSLTSDDGSTLRIDERLVVDNSGNHAAQTKSGEIVLDRGPHSVIVEYAQAGGAHALEWQWARDAAAPEPVPASALSPYRIGYSTAALIRWLEAMFLPALIGFGVLLVWVAFPPKSKFTEMWHSS